MPSPEKLSSKTAFTSLLPGDKFVMIRRAQDEPDASKRVATATQEAVVAALSRAPAQSITLAAAQALNTAALDGTDNGTSGIAYTILRPTGNVTVQWIPADGPNGTPAGFSPVGIWQQPDGTKVFVDYDVDSDTPVPRDIVWRYIGRPADNITSEGEPATTIAVVPYVGGPSNVRVGAACAALSIDRCTNITVAPDSHHITLQSGSNDITLAPGCSYVEVGSGCGRVVIQNCRGSAGTPFVVPANTTDALYRNNALVTTGTSGFGGLGPDLAINGSGEVAWDAAGRYQDSHRLTLTGNAGLLLPTNVPAGGSGFLFVSQDSVGGRTLTVAAGPTSKVPPGFSVPSAANQTVAVVGYIYDGTTFYWNISRY